MPFLHLSSLFVTDHSVWLELSGVPMIWGLKLQCFPHRIFLWKYMLPYFCGEIPRVNFAGIYSEVLQYQIKSLLLSSNLTLIYYTYIAVVINLKSNPLIKTTIKVGKMVSATKLLYTLAYNPCLKWVSQNYVIDGQIY